MNFLVVLRDQNYGSLLTGETPVDVRHASAMVSTCIDLVNAYGDVTFAYCFAGVIAVEAQGLLEGLESFATSRFNHYIRLSLFRRSEGDLKAKWTSNPARFVESGSHTLEELTVEARERGVEALTDHLNTYSRDPEIMYMKRHEVMNYVQNHWHHFVGYDPYLYRGLAVVRTPSGPDVRDAGELVR